MKTLDEVKAAFKPFTTTDWDCYSGAEGDAKILERGELVFVLDDNGLQVMDVDGRFGQLHKPEDSQLLCMFVLFSHLGFTSAVMHDLKTQFDSVMM